MNILNSVINSAIDSVRSLTGTQSALRSRMLPILKERGWAPLNSSPETVLFSCEHEGYGIITAALLADKKTVCVQSMSNVKFGRSQGSKLQAIVDEANARHTDKEARFVVFNTSTSCIAVQFYLPFSDLTADSLGVRLREVISYISSLDEELRNYGF
jgi:hypothetical protein